MRAALSALLLVIAGLLLGPVPAAHAHSDLVSSIPEDGAQLEAAPDEVLLTFSEDLLADTVVVSVQDSAGLVVRVLDLRVEGPDVYATWPPGLTGPDYTLNYRVVSQDGHPVEGSIGFNVPSETAPVASSSPTAAPAVPATVPLDVPAEEPAGSRAPLIAVGVGLAVGIAAGLIFWLVRRRGTPAGTGTTP